MTDTISERDSRTAMLLGPEGLARLRRASVIVFGAGGVGGAAIEALARAGIGRLTVVDNDTVSVSNLNRQILALRSNIGRKKSEAAAERVRDIDDRVEVCPLDVFFSAETAAQFDFRSYDYVIDAVDTVSAKLLLAEMCAACGTPLIACMGTGNKLDPSLLRVGDLYETCGCPLARVMRRELRRRAIDRLTVVWSPEEPRKPYDPEENTETGKHVPGSVSFVPTAAGFMLAGHVIRSLAGV